MSYNGIGLQSVRGSATSGYVQKNLSASSSSSSKISKPGFHESRKKKIQHEKLSNELKDKNKKLNQADDDDDDDDEIKKDLKNHEKLRKIEVKCSNLRDKLEDNDDLNDEEIDFKVNELRTKLLDELSKYKKKKKEVEDKSIETTKKYEYKRLYKDTEKSNKR